jgi:ribulose-phosphate 3-epimerase
MSDILITPSLLSANFQHLQDEVASVEPYADGLQFDVMDGHFVPNLSFGAPVAKWIQTNLPLDVHLMVSNPEDRIREFLDIGVAHITFHAEVTDATERRTLATVIRDAGCTAGIAINPDTPLDAVEDTLSEFDLLLVMSVYPGFGGQEFIHDVLLKVEEARSKYPDLQIQMDGGIDENTAPKCIAAGANNLVSGSFIFGSDNREEAIGRLRDDQR